MKIPADQPSDKSVVYECGCYKKKCEADSEDTSCTADMIAAGSSNWYYIYQEHAMFEYFAASGAAEVVFSCSTNNCNTREACEAYVMPVIKPDTMPSVQSCWYGDELKQKKMALADIPDFPPAEEGKPYKCEWSQLL